MPSARKRRLRKLIKGYLNSTDNVGALNFGTEELKKAESVRLNNLSSTDLKTLLGIPADGKTSDIDDDGAPQAQDFLPRDARESKDTDGDNIGDNRDILLTKLSLDGIYFEKKDGVAGPETGTLYTSISTSTSAEASLQDVVDLPDGTPAQKTAKKDALIALQGETVYTLDGLASLETKIVGEKSSVVSLKSQIAAMSATAGVKIDDAPFYNEVPYKDAGGSVKAFADAAQTSASAPADAATAVIDQMEIDVATIEAL
jgi:hypothetical protein